MVVFNLASKNATYFCFTFHIIGGLAFLSALLYLIVFLIHLYKYIFNIFIVPSKWDDHTCILFGENTFI